MLSEEQKIEIGRMLQEGVSDEGIKAVVASWEQGCWIAQPDVSYAFFVEFGLPPIDESKVMEGSVEKR